MQNPLRVAEGRLDVDRPAPIASELLCVEQVGFNVDSRPVQVLLEEMTGTKN